MAAFTERPEVLANPRAERVRKVAALSGRSARVRAHRLLVEGPQAVRELLTHQGHCVVDVYLTERAVELHPDIAALARQATPWTHRVTEEVASAMSANAQGIIAVARCEAINRSISRIEPGSTLVLLAQGRDPGNVGTIIRTADAMGARAVITVSGTVDITGPKVIRASAGSVFHLPILNVTDFHEGVALVHDLGAQVFGTSGASGSYNLADLMLSATLEARAWMSESHAWAFGNEAQGMSEAELDACDLLVRIDMTGNAESLNVASAAAMCLYASQTVRTMRS